MKKAQKETSKVYAPSKPQKTTLKIHFCFKKIKYFNGKVLLTAQNEQAGATCNSPSYKAALL